MNQIIDSALLLRKENFCEHHLLAYFFSQSHGLVKGILQYGANGKNSADLQNFNLFEIHWKGKNEDLGKLKVGLARSNQSKFLFCKERLYIVNLINNLLLDLICERENNSEVYSCTIKFLDTLSANKKENLKNYYIYEANLLNHLGFSYDLSRCALTGSCSGLYYVSPNTGAACTKEAGDVMKEKLFVLPQFFVGQEDDLDQDLKNADKLNFYFLQKNFHTLSSGFLKNRSNLLKTFGL